MFLACEKMTCGKIQFWKAQNGNFLCSHSLWQHECGHPVWRPWLTIDCFLETVADHRDLMTAVESIYYNLVDIWEVFRISPWFLLGTHKYALRPQIGIWIFWLFGTGWNLASLFPYSKITPHCFQFKTCRGYLFIWHIQNSSNVCKQWNWSLVDFILLYCLNISKHVIFICNKDVQAV